MIVLDTNVISEAMATAPNRLVATWLSSQPRQGLFTTSVSLAEILYGIELLPAGNRRADLLARGERIFSSLFTGRILFFDEIAARSFAPIAVRRRQLGKPITVFDAQIAAIALANDATLATRNTADFESCGIRLINPWVD